MKARIGWSFCLAARCDRSALVAVAGAAMLMLAAGPAAKSASAAAPASFFQEAKLSASDGGGSDFLGNSVAISGDTLVVGAPNHNIGANQDQGAAYVFVKQAGGWADATQTAKLTASDGGAMHEFGTSVAIEGDTIVVGATGADAAYVFVKPPGGWQSTTQAGKLTVPGLVGADLGSSVDVSGTVVIAGAPYSNAGGASQEGAAYIFERPGAAWANTTQSGTLLNFFGEQGDLLGSSVAISGGTAVAGAWSDNVGMAFDQGSVLVFNKPGASWSLLAGGIEYDEATLRAPDGDADDLLGYSVAIEGNTVVAGALGQASLTGAVHVFQGGGVSWTHRRKLVASDASPGQRLGVAVGISGKRIAAGAIGTASSPGSTYVFADPGTDWVNAIETGKLVAVDGSPGDLFGSSVGVTGATVGVGATTDDLANSNQGSAYVFTELADGDGDEVPDVRDNCPAIPNTDQGDSDGDGQGDACEPPPAPPDSDGDGSPDASDNCPGTPNPDRADSDDDGVGDACDSDDDGDGAADAADSCELLPGTAANGCPDIKRKLTLGYSDKKDAFTGQLRPSGPCADGYKLQILRKERGPDELIGKAITKPGGKLKEPEEAPDPGAYYAKVPANTVEDFGNCLGKKSKPLKLD